MRCTAGRRIVCSYCRGETPLREITKDHVIGESWYTTNAGDLEKWKVPACKPCNNELSRVEREILIRLALCLDPSEAAHLAIIEYAMRAIDPAAATNPRDAKHRLALQQKIKREMIIVDRPDAPDVMPSFRENFDIGSRHLPDTQRVFLGAWGQMGKGTLSISPQEAPAARLRHRHLCGRQRDRATCLLRTIAGCFNNASRTGSPGADVSRDRTR
jgi:hypothetical protein